MARVVLGADDDEELVVTPDRRGPADLPLHQLQVNPANPRPSQLRVDEMAEDLKRNGQLQNINVMSRAAFTRPDAKPELADRLSPAPYVIVNGNRRFAAAEQAGLTALRYEIKDDWTAREIDEAVVRENIHRQDMNPMHLGRFLLGMLPRYNDSQRQLAKAISKTQPWVNQLINLTKLHPDLQSAVESGTVRFAVARECTRLHPDLQPLLASGELPEEVAQGWLMKERIKADEQWERWSAGPPYIRPEGNGMAPTPGNEYPTREEASTNGAAPKTHERGADAEVAGTATSREIGPAAFEGADQRQPRTRRNGDGGFALRAFERSPRAIADALRTQLTSEEIGQLISALRSST